MRRSVIVRPSYYHPEGVTAGGDVLCDIGADVLATLNGTHVLTSGFGDFAPDVELVIEMGCTLPRHDAEIDRTAEPGTTMAYDCR